MRKFCFSGVRDGSEHAPGGVLERGVAGDAVEDEDGFDGLGSVSSLAYIGVV